MVSKVMRLLYFLSPDHLWGTSILQGMVEKDKRPYPIKAGDRGFLA
jgi:hypothetical protein